MARVKRLFGSCVFTDELLRGKHTPIAYKADFVQSVRMLFAYKTLFPICVSHWLLTFKTCWGTEVTEWNVAAI